MIPTSKVIDLIKGFKTNNSILIDDSIRELIKISEKRGQTNIAKQLRSLHSKPTEKPATPNPDNLYSASFTASQSTSNLFEFRSSKVKKSDLILSNKNEDIFEEIKENYLKKDLFLKHKIPFDDKVLLYGPPGTGKTLFTYVLAGELDIPVIHVHLDSLISSYLGETGKNIKTIFNEASKQKCILFLDEFDTIAKQRDDMQELGELKRVVTVLLQNIDALSGDVVLVAATNHEHLLDKAIWRRFDYQLNLDRLDQKGRNELFKVFLGKRLCNDTELLALMTEGLSGAIIRQIVNKALRKHLISNGDKESLKKYLIGEVLLRNGRLFKKYDKGSERQVIKKVIIELRKYNPKTYTYAHLEDVTGIPDSTLSNLTK